MSLLKTHHSHIFISGVRANRGYPLTLTWSLPEKPKRTRLNSLISLPLFLFSTIQEQSMHTVLKKQLLIRFCMQVRSQLANTYSTGCMLCCVSMNLKINLWKTSMQSAGVLIWILWRLCHFVLLKIQISTAITAEQDKGKQWERKESDFNGNFTRLHHAGFALVWNGDLRWEVLPCFSWGN